MRWMRPPALLCDPDVLATVRRRWAAPTWRPLRPLTRTRRNVCCALPDWSTLLVPKLLRGLEENADTSASIVAVTGGQVQSARQAPGQALLSCPSHSSPAWLTVSSPHTGAQVQSGRQRPGQRASAPPSHSPVARFRTLP